MKPGAFALNPHAASYVPLSKRVDCGGDDGLVFEVSPTHILQGQQISFSGVEVPKKSSELAYKQIRDDDLDMEMDIDMDIEYLLVTFSGLSQESITDVYLANSGDLEATIEMLNQLEVKTFYFCHVSVSLRYISHNVESLNLSLFLFDVMILKDNSNHPFCIDIQH